MKNLYSPLISKGHYIHTSRRAAELIKYASNASQLQKITFINEIANLCEKINVNVEDISIGIGLDKEQVAFFIDQLMVVLAFLKIQRQLQLQQINIKQIFQL